MVSDYIDFKGTRWEKKLGVEIDENHWNFLFKSILPADIKYISLADDWQHAVKKGNGWTKYGRQMYSKKLDMLRHQTMDEFYNNGIVD